MHLSQLHQIFKLILIHFLILLDEHDIFLLQSLIFVFQQVNLYLTNQQVFFLRLNHHQMKIIDFLIFKPMLINQIFFKITFFYFNFFYHLFIYLREHIQLIVICLFFFVYLIDFFFLHMFIFSDLFHQLNQQTFNQFY